MTTVLELDDDVIHLLFPYLDDATIASLRLTHSRFSEICAKPIYTKLVKWTTEIETERWAYQHNAAPRHILHTKTLTILNQPRPPFGSEFFKDSIPALYVNQTYETDGNGGNESIKDQEDTAGVVHYDRQYRLNHILKRGVFVESKQPSRGKLMADQLQVFEWRHALPISLLAFNLILGKHYQSLRALDISELGPSGNNENAREFKAMMDLLPQSQHVESFTIRAIDEYKNVTHARTGSLEEDRLWAIRKIFTKLRSSVLHLRISNEHSASQIFDHSAFYKLFNFDHILFEPDHWSIDPALNDADMQQLPYTLQLKSLELGWFNVQYLCASIDTLLANKVCLQVNVGRLRRLVIEDCGNILDLLYNLTSQAENDNLHLTEFALRHTFPPEAGTASDADPVYSRLFDQALNSFLFSFSGLELLALLLREGMDGTHEIIYTGLIWLNHHATLKSFVSDLRTDYEYIHVATPDATGPRNIPTCISYCSGGRTYLDLVDKFVASNLDEIGFCLNYHDQQQSKDYYLLRLFSQFHNLRAVHVRCEPDGTGNWRDCRSNVSHGSLRQATIWANRIALPYFMSITSVAGTETPFLLEYFAEIDSKVAAFHGKIRNARLEDRPPMPKLRLLIVGDWGYRDLMNLAGPRLCYGRYAPREWNEEEPYNASWSRQILPIFFEVTWDWVENPVGTDAHELERVEQDHQRAIGVEFPGWRARVRALEQTTVKGYPELPGGEVKMLNFAWQD